jgi:hypothetical protein
MVTLAQSVERLLRANDPSRESAAADLCDLVLSSGLKEDIVFNNLRDIALREKKDAYDGLLVVMHALESMTPHEMDLALKLMALLYPHANEIYAHDICDAIDTWMYEEVNESILEFLLKLVNESTDEAISKKYLQWIDRIAERKKHKSVSDKA